MFCPHCDTPVFLPPIAWQAWAPWNCSHCGGLYGLDKIGPYKIPLGAKPLSPLVNYAIAKRWCFYAGRQNFYTYALCYPSGLPFYVGQGKFERALAHLAEAERTPIEKRTAKHETIHYIWSLNEDVHYCFLGLFRTRDESIKLENQYIDYYGLRARRGTLTNLAGEREPASNVPLSPIGFPEEQECVHHPGAIGKWKFSIRVFHNSDYVVSPPRGIAIVSGAVADCPACGQPGQLNRDMRHLKLLCSYCSHYFIPSQFDAKPDDGTERQFFSRPPVERSIEGSGSVEVLGD